MNAYFVLAVYSFAVVASSLVGGWLPTLVRLTHVRMQVGLSFVGGMMLGVGLLHMLPHAVVELASLDRALQWSLLGLLGMFLLIRTFHFHEHGCDDELAADDHHECGGHECGGHECGGHECGGHRADSVEAPVKSLASDGGSRSVAPAVPTPHGTVSWLGVAVGLSLHAFLDGVALGAGVMADVAHRPTGAWAGLGVFLAIVLHKPLDALSITTLMKVRQWPRSWQQAVNAGFALMCPLGAIVFVQAVPYVSAERQVTGIALAITAGVFLCISLSDLLPEVQFHRHDRLKLSAALLLGVACAYGIYYVEPPHSHGVVEAEWGDHDHDHDHDHDPDHATDSAHEHGHDEESTHPDAPRETRSQP